MASRRFALTDVIRFSEAIALSSGYLKIAVSLCQSEALCLSPSCLDGAGCAALTGSDAGNVSI